ncbi:MAG: OmpA family protein [Bacteroidales bacterium]|nr:MAG: OmpA family protein [Bacteroidales bacterium]
MRIFIKPAILLLGLGIITFSCVSTKQYKELQETSRKFLEERDLLKNENNKLSVLNTEMKTTVNELEKKVSDLEEEIDRKTEEADQLQKDYNLLNRRFFDLQTAQEDLIQGNVKETRRLLKQLQTTQEELITKEDELRELERSLNSKKSNLDELQFELANKNTRLLELENILFQKDSVVNALKVKVSSALLGFENNGLTVTLKNSKVYVSLEEQLLFKTGSTEVDQNGINALKKLAKVLETNPDINIMIEGHTDDVPYLTSGGPIKDNWDLSVKRATSIVRILLDGSTIDPKRLIAAGRGEFMPVDPAKTPEARTKNRRTEIILTPKLDELFRILESN